MNRIAATLAVVLLSTGAAVAQDVAVTRAEPAELFVAPADLALLPAETVTLTTSGSIDLNAAEVLTPRDRALNGIESGETVAVTVFQGTGSTISVR